MFFYTVIIRVYVFFIHVASLFNPKARKAIQGRKDFFKLNTSDKADRFIWFHCASLGEFEQGRPLIEKIKKENPDKKILLSFFSPSGYEIRKNFPVDKVIYLPFDTSSNTQRFFETFNIELAVFVKYDVWPFYMKQLVKRNIPVFLISALFRNDQFFFKWYGKFFLDLLKQMKTIFVQNEYSHQLAIRHQLERVVIAGDTRIDRVVDVKNNVKNMPLIEDFLRGEKCIVFGSIYTNEISIVKYILSNLDPDIKLILVPHQVDEKTIELFKQDIPNMILYSQMEKFQNERIILIDHIGSLNQLYQYAQMVYVGGGFGLGVHNILEPAVYNIPVYFGPRHLKFPEASSLINEKLAFSFNSQLIIAQSMTSKIGITISETFVQDSIKWFTKRSGATQLIYNDLSMHF